MENDEWKMENELSYLLLLGSVLHFPFSIYHLVVNPTLFAN